MANVGFRLVQTFQTDTLQSIAAREMGDASQWVNIALLNGLRPPYLVTDPTQITATTALAGGVLRVPAPISVSATASDVFGTDVALAGGLLSSDGSGRLQLVSGVPNLKQAITIRIGVDQGELLYHQKYGSRVGTLRGKKGGPNTNTLAAFYVKSAILSDPRVGSVTRVSATMIGDDLAAGAAFIPVSLSTPVTLTLGT